MPEINGEFKNILIIKPSAAGDIICALPVLSALRQKFPDAKISWLVASHLSGLLSGHPLIDNIIEFDRRRFGYITRSFSVTRRFLRFLHSLRDANYDLVMDLQGLFRSGFLAWRSQAPVRIGPAERREMGWVFYTHRAPSMNPNSHTVERMFSCMKLFDAEMEIPDFPVHITPQAVETIHGKLKAYHIKQGEYITIAPGGTWESKRWDWEKFAELIKIICSELQLPVVLVGGKHERMLGEQISSALINHPVANLTEQTSLQELLAVISESKGLVSNDSGPMHIAVALKRPVTAIIGPTNPYRTGPYGRPESVVSTSLDCSPCYKRNCTKVSDGELPLCMKQISVEEVFTNLCEQLT